MSLPGSSWLRAADPQLSLQRHDGLLPHCCPFFNAVPPDPEGTKTILEGTTGAIDCSYAQIQPMGAAWGIEGVCQDTTDAVF